VNELPAAWKRLTEGRRKLLWALAQRPERTVTHIPATMATLRMLMALSVDGLVTYATPQPDAINRCTGYSYAAAATPAGRALVAEVQRLDKLYGGSIQSSHK